MDGEDRVSRHEAVAVKNEWLLEHGQRWLATFLQRSLPAVPVNDLLSSGRLLGYLAGVISMRLGNQTPTDQAPSDDELLASRKGKHVLKDLNAFLSLCAKLGVDKEDLCTCGDVVEGRNTPQICRTLWGLSRRCQQLDVPNMPPFATQQEEAEWHSLIPQTSIKTTAQRYGTLGRLSVSLRRSPRDLASQHDSKSAPSPLSLRSHDLPLLKAATASGASTPDGPVTPHSGDAVTLSRLDSGLDGCGADSPPQVRRSLSSPDNLMSPPRSTVYGVAALEDSPPSGIRRSISGLPPPAPGFVGRVARISTELNAAASPMTLGSPGAGSVRSSSIDLCSVTRNAGLTPALARLPEGVSTPDGGGSSTDENKPPAADAAKTLIAKARPPTLNAESADAWLHHASLTPPQTKEPRPSSHNREVSYAPLGRSLPTRGSSADDDSALEQMPPPNMGQLRAQFAAVSNGPAAEADRQAGRQQDAAAASSPHSPPNTSESVQQVQEPAHGRRSVHEVRQKYADSSLPQPLSAQQQASGHKQSGAQHTSEAGMQADVSSPPPHGQSRLKTLFRRLRNSPSPQKPRQKPRQGGSASDAASGTAAKSLALETVQQPPADGGPASQLLPEPARTAAQQQPSAQQGGTKEQVLQPAQVQPPPSPRPQQQLLQDDTSLWQCGTTPQKAGAAPALARQPPPQEAGSSPDASSSTEASSADPPAGLAAQQSELRSSLPGASVPAVAPEPKSRKRQSIDISLDAGATASVKAALAAVEDTAYAKSQAAQIAPAAKREDAKAAGVKDTRGRRLQTLGRVVGVVAAVAGFVIATGHRDVRLIPGDCVTKVPKHMMRDMVTVANPPRRMRWGFRL